MTGFQAARASVRSEARMTVTGNFEGIIVYCPPFAHDSRSGVQFRTTTTCHAFGTSYCEKDGAGEGTRPPDPIITNFGGDLLERAGARPSTLANAVA